jgi:hypothetical protein
MSKFEVWQNHLGACPVCKKALRARFVGASMQKMHDECCDVGKPLYAAFLQSNGDGRLKRTDTDV